jgi:hypothetical protein
MSSRRVFAVLPLLVAACSSTDPPSSSAGDTGTGTVDTGGVVTDSITSTDTAKVPCSEPIEDRPAGSVCVKTVTGKVVDPTGAPVAGKLVSVCGSICFFGETGADGSFSATVGSFIKVSNFAASVHGRPTHASLYEKLPLSGMGDIALPATMVLPPMPATGTLIPTDKRIVTATAPLTHGELSLTFQTGTEMELDLEDVELAMAGKGGDHLRAVKVAEKDYPAFVKGANVKLLYAATPFDAKFTKKVAVTINATGGIAEGTAVEIIALGNEFLKEPFTAGVVEVVATGKVSGGKIVTDVGQGISTLTWIGVRAK